MTTLLLAAVLTYQIPLTTLDGKQEELTVEDASPEQGQRFLFCHELGEDGKVYGLACKVSTRGGVEFWVQIPAS